MDNAVTRYNLRYCPPLAPGQEFWTCNPHEMSVRLRRAQRRGEVVLIGRAELGPGVHGAVVQRLRPRRPEWIGRAVALSGVALLCLAALMLARMLVVPLTVLAVVLAAGALYGGLRRTGGHRAACAGLHCAGCRR